MPEASIAALAIGEAGPLGSFGNIQVEPLSTPITLSPFDISLICTEIGDELCGRLVYNSDIFLPQTIDRMAHHFVHFLSSLVKDPLQKVQSFVLRLRLFVDRS